MSIKFKVVNYCDAAQLRRDLAYSPVNLSDAMMQQASLFAHYGVQAALASKQVDTLKMLVETAEAKVYRQLADKLAIKGEKVVVASVDKDVANEESIISLKKALNEAKQIEKSCNIAVEAFRHRRDMLVQQGLLSREEMKGEVAIAVKNARDQEFEGQKNRLLELRVAKAAAGEG